MPGIYAYTLKSEIKPFLKAIWVIFLPTKSGAKRKIFLFIKQNVVGLFVRDSNIFKIYRNALSTYFNIRPLFK